MKRGEEGDRLREALEILADEDNWTAEARTGGGLPLLYGHFQPWEVAQRALGPERTVDR